MSVPSKVLSCPDLQAELPVYSLGLPHCSACAEPLTSRVWSGCGVVRCVRPPHLTFDLQLRCLRCSLAVYHPGLDSLAVHLGLPVIHKSFPAYCLDCVHSHPCLLLSCLQVCLINLLTLTLHLSPPSRSLTLLVTKFLDISYKCGCFLLSLKKIFQ